MHEMRQRPVIIVGAGLFGATLAERIASLLNRPVTVIDRRSHIAGNCWSDIAPGTEIERHVYGSHIFHTSHDDVWDYVNGFSAFNDFERLVNEHITIYNAISLGFIDSAGDAARHHLDTCLSSFIHHYLANASKIAR